MYKVYQKKRIFSIIFGSVLSVQVGMRSKLRFEGVNTGFRRIRWKLFFIATEGVSRAFFSVWETGSDERRMDEHLSRLEGDTASQETDLIPFSLAKDTTEPRARTGVRRHDGCVSCESDGGTRSILRPLSGSLFIVRANIHTKIVSPPWHQRK